MSDLPCDQRVSIDRFTRDALHQSAVERFVAEHAECDGSGAGSVLGPRDKLREVEQKRRLDAKLQECRFGSGGGGCCAPREEQGKGALREAAHPGMGPGMATCQNRHIAMHNNRWAHGSAAAPTGAASTETRFAAGS